MLQLHFWSLNSSSNHNDIIVGNVFDNGLEQNIGTQHNEPAITCISYEV